MYWLVEHLMLLKFILGIVLFFGKLFSYQTLVMSNVDGSDTLTNNLQEFLSPDVYKMVSASIHPVLKYRWTGKMMEPMGK